MEPEEVGKKPYALLKQALEETKKVAVAKIAFRDREHLAALSPLDGHMLMNTLHWPDEIRSVEGIKGVDGNTKVSDRELQMAKTLIESLADSFEPDRYQDNYKEALMQVVEAKVAGQETVAAPEPEAAPRVMDLMEALKASVEAAKKSKPAAAAATKPAKQRARKAS